MREEPSRWFRVRRPRVARGPHHRRALARRPRLRLISDSRYVIEATLREDDEEDFGVGVEDCGAMMRSVASDTPTSSVTDAEFPRRTGGSRRRARVRCKRSKCRKNSPQYRVGLCRILLHWFIGEAAVNNLVPVVAQVVKPSDIGGGQPWLQGLDETYRNLHGLGKSFLDLRHRP